MAAKTNCPHGRGARRAQSSLEFVALFAVALAFFILLYLYLANEKMVTAEGYAVLEARSLARQIASLMTAAGISAGSYQQFSLPYAIGGKAYNLTVTDDSVWVDWAGGSFAAGFAAGSIRNSTSPAPFVLGGGNHFVNNTAGTVWVV